MSANGNDRLNELLRKLLREMRQEQSESAASDPEELLERALPGLVKARYRSPAPLSEEEKAAMFQRVSTAARARAGGPSEGPAPDKPSVQPPPTQTRRYWPALAAAALVLAAAVVALVLLRSAPTTHPEPIVAGGPDNPPEPSGGGTSDGPVLPPPIEPAKPQRYARPQPTRRDRSLPPQEIVKPVPPTRLGRFVAVKGSPSVSGPGAPGGGVALEDTAVFAGTLIETHPGETADLRFDDGTTIKLRGGAIAKVIRARRMQLDFGMIEANVGKSQTGADFEIVTPTATATVLGTRFTLEVREIDPTTELQRGGQGRPAASPARLETRLRVLEGAVGFSNGQGEEMVGRLMEAIARWNEKPTQPVRLGSLKTVVLAIRHAHITASVRPALPAAAWRLAYPVGWAGLQLGDVASADGAHAVLVTRVVHGSPAQAAGVKVGDVVRAMEGVENLTASSASAFIKSHRNEQVSLSLGREDRTVAVNLRTVADPYVAGASEGIPLSTDVLEATRLLIGQRGAEGASKLEQALERNPNDAAGRNNLGVHFETEDALWLAIANYTKAVELQPNVALYRLNLGMALYSAGDFYRATAQLRKALELAPGCREAANKLGEAFEVSGRFDESVELAAGSTRRLPDSSDAWRDLASALVDADRPQEALEAAQHAIRLEPDYADAHSLLGTIHNHMDRKEDALEAFERAAHLDPTEAVYFDQVGMINDDLGREAEAEAAFQRAVGLDPARSLTYSNFGYHHKQFGRPEEAERLYRKAIELDPSYSGAYMNLGALFINDPARQDEAEALFVEAIAADPDNSTAWSNLGVLAGKRGDAKTEESLYRRAIEASPRDASAFFNLAYLCGDQKRFSEAEQLLLRGLEVGPRETRMYTELAWVYEQTGRPLEAEAMYKQTIERDPEWTWVRQRLAVHYSRLGRHAEAALVYKEIAEKFQPDDALTAALVADELRKAGDLIGAETYYRRSMDLGDSHTPDTSSGLALVIVARGGDLDEALDLARQAVSEGEKNLARGPNWARWVAGWIEALGRVYTARGEFDEAEQALRRALELRGNRPEAADTWFYLGQLFEVMKDRDRALEAYRSALKILPDHKAATEAVKRIGGGLGDIDGTGRRAMDRALEVRSQ